MIRYVTLTATRVAAGLRPSPGAAAEPVAELAEAAAGTAAELARLDLDAHAATKLRARRLAGTALREAIDSDDAAYRARLAAQPAG
jgi:hypothetical protein